MCHSNKISQSGRFIMDLLQLLWQKKYQVIKPSLLLSAAISLTACAGMEPAASTETTASQPEVEAVSAEVKPPEVEPLPFNSELVYYVLTAELAGQRGEIGVATELYNKAAMSIDSPALASRSAEVANYTRDKARISRALDRWEQVDPNNASVYIMQAPFLIMKNDKDGFVKAVDAAVRLEPEKSQLILTQVTEDLSKFAKPEFGLPALQRLELYTQDDPDALFSYAKLATYYQQYEPALSNLNQLLELQKNREDALILKAEVLQRQGKSEEALNVLKKPASKSGASDDLLFAYAKLLGQNGKTEESRIIFEQLNEKLPKNEEILFALGLIGLEEKQSDVAKQYFTQLIALGDRGKQAAYFMGLTEELEKDTDAALIWFASVPADSIRFQSAQVRYINLLADNGQLEKARLHLKLLRKENPKNAEQYYIFEGAFLRERYKNQEAFDLYSEALILYPTNQELLYGRAMVAESLDNLAVFEQDLKTLLEMDPNNGVVLNALGYTLADRTDRHQEALALIKRAMAISPNDPFYIDSLGWVYYRLGDLDKARHYLKLAVSIKPDAEFSAHLGEVLWQKGEKEQAMQVWQEALKADPENKLLKDTMRRFGL